jgi:hypothetical protein
MISKVFSINNDKNQLNTSKSTSALLKESTDDHDVSFLRLRQVIAEEQRQ